MNKQKKRKLEWRKHQQWQQQQQIALQPWGHHEEELPMLAQGSNGFNDINSSRHTGSFEGGRHRQQDSSNNDNNNNNNNNDNNNKNDRAEKQRRTSPTSSTNMKSSNHAITSAANKGRHPIDYVKRNQSNIHSYSVLSANYEVLLSDDMDHFVPINPNANHSENTSQYLKRPIISTTYIGYYDEEPFVIDNPLRCSNIHRRQAIKHWSSESKSRPRTTDPVPCRDNSKIKVIDRDKHKVLDRQKEVEEVSFYQHFCDKTTYTVGNYHLQKVLKIKEKLRQKLKRNSEKKDNERGAYLKSTIRIEDQKQKLNHRQKQKVRQKSRTIQNNFYNHHSPEKKSISPSRFSSLDPSRKSSMQSVDSNQKEKQREKRRVDKWKQYIKMQEQQRLSKTESPSRNFGVKFLGVVGGSIYK